VSFEPENALEETLARAATDPLARPEFYRLLMESELVVLGTAAPAAEEGRLDLQIATLRYNGRDFLAAFTAMSRFVSFAGPERPHFTLAARQLFEATKGANFAINPNASHGKLLSAAEIAYWLEPSARAKRNLLRASEARLAPYREPPKKLIEALSIFFLNRQAIRAAHILEATLRDGREPPHPLIGIEMAGGDWRRIANEVSELSAAIMADIIIDLAPIDRNDGPESLSARLLQVPPFYSRTQTLN
jgi:hypothetical protein